MGARNETKAKNAIAQLNQSKSPGFGEVIFLKMDLSDPRSTKKAANCFLQLEDRLDILSESEPWGSVDFRTEVESSQQRGNVCFFVLKMALEC